MSHDTSGDSETEKDVSPAASENALTRVVSHQNSNDGLRRVPIRNKKFHPEWEPFRDHHALQLNDTEIDGAFWFMYPTHAMYTYLGKPDLIRDGQGQEESISQPGQQNANQSAHSADTEYKWTSRDNRKGRHTLVVRQSSEHYDTPPPTTGFPMVLRGIYRMGTTFSFWDTTYLTAVAFTLAVTVLLINATLSAVPYIRPRSTMPSGTIYVEGALTLVGSSLFLVSSFLSFIEAVNANRRGCLGWKREHVSFTDTSDVDVEHGRATRIVPDRKCEHRVHNFGNVFRSSNNKGDKTKDPTKEGDEWRWFPTKHELLKHFIYDLGFITCCILLISSALYTCAAVAALVSILRTNGEIAQWVRIPQLIAGLGFTISSILFLLETQTQWHLPELRAIGWHVSLWNTVGSIGFTLCAAFALTGAEPGDEWAEYQFVFSFMWGSIGFLIGSVIQWYEALDKHPVQLLKKKTRGEK